MKKTRIFTHVSIDMDAACSVWFFLKFILKKKPGEVEIIFKPANWDGQEIEEGDFALDIYAGGKGIKGEFKYNRTRSCLMSLLDHNLESVDKEIRRAVVSLTTFVDKHDSEGIGSLKKLKFSEAEKGDLVDLRGLLKVFMGYHTNVNNDDYQIFIKFFENLENHFNLISKSREIKENLKCVDPNTKVAFVKNSHVPSGLLFNQGKKVVVYVDGNDLGVVVGDSRLKSDELVSVVREIVEEAGEKFGEGENNWFIDPGKRLICRGSRKSPATKPSKVNPEKLFDSLVSFVDKFEAQIYQH